MSKSKYNNNPINLAKVGNFTKHAIESFEEGIVNETDYLEKTNSISSRKNKK